MFKNKILLITGGTGSFGNAVLNRFLDTDIKEIRIFSRDEKNPTTLHRWINEKKGSGFAQRPEPFKQCKSIFL